MSSEAAQVVPVRIETRRDQLAGVFAPAGAGSRGVPVLFCGPWGWDEVASYRARRDWALLLAAAGHPTLRFDLPAVGDSTGTPAEADLVGRWIEAVAAAGAWLDGMTGSSGIAVVGLGLGGLLALAALAQIPSITTLILWGTPASGRRFVREQRAFSRMQPWNADENFDPGVPDGWLEAGGFAMSPGTLAELADLTVDSDGPTGLRRVLALDRDGIQMSPEILEGLDMAGVEVTRAAGAGWGEMFSHPETAILPRSVAVTVADWLAVEPVSAGRSEETGPQTADETGPIRFEVGGTNVREEAWRTAQPWGQVFGVAAAAERVAGVDHAVIFANAGAVRHIGPSRLWVEVARSCAGAGIPSLRVDLEGIGEADGEPGGYLTGGDFNGPRFEEQLCAVLDAYSRHSGVDRFTLVGLCAGGHNSFRATLADGRVVEVLLINASGLRWDDRLPGRREARKAVRVLDRRWLGKLLRGQIGRQRLRIFFAALAGRPARLPGEVAERLRRGPSLEQQIEGDLDRLADRGVHVVLAFSGEEPLDHELHAAGIEAKITEQQGFSYRRLPGSDHTLRPPVAQRAACDFIRSELTAADQVDPGRAPLELESN